MSTRTLTVIGPLAGLILALRNTAALQRVLSARMIWLRRRTKALVRRNRAQPELTFERPERYSDWEHREHIRSLRRARDMHELERRQRMWDRNECGDYRMTGW